MTTRTSTNFWLDVVSLVVMLGLAATGGLIHFVLPAGSGHFYKLFGWNRHDFGQLHFYLAVGSVVLLALHVLLHWSWVCGVVGKSAGRPAPSRTARTIWGLSLLFGTVVFLAGGLWWASNLVQKSVPEGGGRGRRAHLEGMASVETATTSLKAEEPVAPPAASPPSAASSISRSVGGDGTGVREQHADECPAGAAIDGRTSLKEAARICGLTVGELVDKLNLPASTAPEEHLGRLKRRHDLDLHAVRRLACRQPSQP